MVVKIDMPRKQVVIKFILLCGLLVGYTAYLSYKFDLLTGGLAALLTWSFFVLCTPVADAGFLLDFPLRIILGVRMVVSEIAVWLIAISLNISMLLWAGQYYETTLITRILHHVLTEPYPYWGIIMLSMAGTFLSVKFGDELMDVLHHKDRSFFHAHQLKYELILIAFFLIVLFGYTELMVKLGLSSVVEISM